MLISTPRGGRIEALPVWVEGDFQSGFIRSFQSDWHSKDKTIWLAAAMVRTDRVKLRFINSAVREKRSDPAPS